MEKPRPLWRRQLEAATLGIDRVLAAQVLAQAPAPDGIDALGKALGDDPFWAVRAAAARALGRTRRQDALLHLLAARSQPHPRVRRAVAIALGEFRGDPRAAETLVSWLRAGDPSAFVEAEAALALGKTRAPTGLDLLASVARRPSYQEVIRSRAIEGMGATGDERALSLLRAEWRSGGPFQPRRAVVAALAELAQGTEIRPTREFLEDRFSDPDFRVRMEIAVALARLGDRQSVPAIERALAAELDGRARRRMREALSDLADGTHPAEQVVRLKEELTRLRTDTTQLRERLEKLEARDSAKSPRPILRPPRAVANAAKPSKRLRPTARRGGRRPVLPHPLMCDGGACRRWTDPVTIRPQASTGWKRCPHGASGVPGAGGVIPNQSLTVD